MAPFVTAARSEPVSRHEGKSGCMCKLGCSPLWRVSTVIKAEVGSAKSGGEAVAEETVSLENVRTT